MENFTSFLFGNIGTTNQLEDDSTLDKDTRAALSALPSSLFPMPSLLKDESNGESQDMKEIKQIKYKEAVDFSLESELADEIPTSTNRRPLTEKQMDNDDYDNVEINNATALNRSELNDSNNNASFIKSKVISTKNNPDSTQIQNWKKDKEQAGGTGILRFSEMFGPLKHVDVTKKEKKLSKKVDPSLSQHDLELDETDLLSTNFGDKILSNNMTNDYYFHQQQQMDELSDDIDDGYSPTTFANQEPILKESIDKAVFEPVQQLEWEDHILWDEEKQLQQLHYITQRDNNTKRKVKTVQSAQTQNDTNTNDIDKTVDSADIVDTKNIKNSDRNDTSNEINSNNNITNAEEWIQVENEKSSYVLDDPQVMMTSNIIENNTNINIQMEPKQITKDNDNNRNNDNNNNNATTNSATNGTSVEKKSAFQFINRDFANGKWEQLIIWDTKDICKNQFSSNSGNNNVVLDMNDEYLLFEELEGSKPPSGVSISKDKSKDQKPSSVKTNRSDAKEPHRHHKHKTIRKLSKSGLQVEREAPPIIPIITPTDDSILDPFNISLDKYYPAQRAKSALRLSRIHITHSTPALKLSIVPTYLSHNQLVNFHRPTITFTSGSTLRIVPQIEDNSNSSNGATSVLLDIMQKKSELSAIQDRVVLMEYTEENPPVVQNVGMASKLVNYWRRTKDGTGSPSPVVDGSTIILEHSDESPFLGDIVSGKNVQSVENNMFKAPVFPHNAAPTDFLLIRNRNSNRWVVREIPMIYVVGQLQPLMEVPAPNSRPAALYIKNRLQAYIYRLFKKKTNSQQRLRIADLCNAFPNHSETSIRKRLKEIADFQRTGDDSGWWVAKNTFTLPTDEELRTLITPEMACNFESMLAGQARLQDMSIDRLTTTAGVNTAIAQIDELGDRQLSEQARVIDEQLKLTPWNITSNFINAMQGKGQLQLTGTGDPSGRGEAFSFLRAPLKPAAPKVKQQAPKAVVTGTDADLRKLSLPQSRQVLLKFGIDDKTIADLSRWDRIALIRKMSSEAAASGDDPTLTKFARGSRYTAHLQHQQYKEQCQAIFEQQLSALSRVDIDSTDDDDNEEELEKLEKSLEQSLLQEQSRNVDEREDMEEFNRLKASLVSPRMSPPSSPSSISTSDMPGGSKTRQFVKRTVITKNPDGTENVRVEIIKDPIKVGAYLKRQIEAAKKGKPMTYEEEEEKQRMRREKRRLQEQLRRLRRNQEKQAANRERLLSGDVDQSSNLQLKCGACGMPGHMRTNRNCPLYVEPSKTDSSSTQKRSISRQSVDAGVKREGTKLKFSKNTAPPSTVIEGDKVRIVVKKETLDMLGASSSAIHTPHRKRGRPPLRDEEEDYHRELDDDEVIEKYAQHKSRRRAGPEVALANTLEELWEEIKEWPCAAPFIKPVNQKYAPGYYQEITQPMDLQKMREKIRAFSYATPDDFIKDAALIAKNCHQYCDVRFPHLPPVAEQLLQLVQQKVAQLQSEGEKQNDNGPMKEEEEEEINIMDDHEGLDMPELANN